MSSPPPAPLRCVALRCPLCPHLESCQAGLAPAACIVPETASCHPHPAPAPCLRCRWPPQAAPRETPAYISTSTSTSTCKHGAGEEPKLEHNPQSARKEHHTHNRVGARTSTSSRATLQRTRRSVAVSSGDSTNAGATAASVKNHLAAAGLRPSSTHSLSTKSRRAPHSAEWATTCSANRVAHSITGWERRYATSAPGRSSSAARQARVSYTKRTNKGEKACWSSRNCWLSRRISRRESDAPPAGPDTHMHAPPRVTPHEQHGETREQRAQAHCPMGGARIPRNGQAYTANPSTNTRTHPPTLSMHMQVTRASTYHDWAGPTPTTGPQHPLRRWTVPQLGRPPHRRRPEGAMPKRQPAAASPPTQTGEHPRVPRARTQEDTRFVSAETNGAHEGHFNGVGFCAARATVHVRNVTFPRPSQTRQCRAVENRGAVGSD